MKTLLFFAVLSISIASTAAELNCTVYSPSRGGAKILGLINTSVPDQAKFALTKSGKVVTSSDADKLSLEDKLSAVTIAFSNRNNNSNEPFVVIGQLEKIDGMDMTFNKPLLSSSGTSIGLNVNYLDKDIAINCGQ